MADGAARQSQALATLTGPPGGRAGDDEERLLSALWNVMRHYPFRLDPLFVEQERAREVKRNEEDKAKTRAELAKLENSDDANPDQVPIARPRSAPVNAALTSASDCGIANAAPIPWTQRAATSSGAFGAAAHAPEATAKSAMPTTNQRRRP